MPFHWNTTTPRDHLEALAAQALASAIGHHRANRPDLAEAAYRSVLALDPAHPDGLHLLGALRLSRGDGPAAERSIRRALRISPASAIFFNSLAERHRVAARSSTAEDCSRRALALDPGYALPQLNIARAAFLEGRFAVGRDALRRHVQLAPPPTLPEPSPAPPPGKAPAALPSRRRLDGVTLVAVDCAQPQAALFGLRRCLARCSFERALLFTDRELDAPDLETVRIPPLSDRDAYSHFMMKRLVRHIGTPHVLVAQWDGFIVDPDAWTDAFLRYDYVGARWPTLADDRNVGNGGFSLRSRRLLDALQDERIAVTDVEDMRICRTYRPYLEERHGIAFAPGELADRFSQEHAAPSARSFGFHGVFNLRHRLDRDGLKELAAALPEVMEPGGVSRMSLAHALLDHGCIAEAARLVDVGNDPARPVRATLPPAGVPPATLPPATLPPREATSDSDAERMATAALRAGLARHQAGAPAAAIALYRRCLAVMPGRADALHLMGAAELQGGGAAGAVRLIERALRLEPANAVFLNSAGAAWNALGQTGLAQRRFLEAVRLAPGYREAGDNLRRLPDTGEGCDVEGLRRRLALQPGFADGWLRLGKAMAGVPAEAALRRALALAPENAEAMAALGDLRRTQGRLDEAAARFRTALLFDRTCRPAIDGLRRLPTGRRAPARRPDEGPGGRAAVVAVWIRYDWHWAILDRLVELLRADGRVAVLRTLDEIVGLMPDLVIGADAGSLAALRRALPAVETVHVCHGLISKNQPAAHYGQVDHVCLSGELVRQRLREAGVAPRRDFWVTGYLQMDRLFRRQAPSPAFARPPDMPVLLYAPTHNASLSSARLLGDRIVERLAGPKADKLIVVKPHPHLPVSDPGLLDLWRALARRHPNFLLVDPPSADIVPYLLAADLLVSDASSVAFQFVALDRPIVFIDNPERFADKEFYDPDGIEWRWRGIGDRADGARTEEVDALWRRVDAGLAAPAARGEERRRCRDALFGELTDGRAAERIVERIEAVYGRRRHAV